MKYLKVFGLFALTMFMYANAQANSAWQFEKEEDLFSSSNKSAYIYTAVEHGREVLIFVCKQKTLTLKWAYKAPRAYSDMGEFSIPVAFAIKIDNNNISKFESYITYGRSNFGEVDFSQAYDNSTELMKILKQIRNAKSKITVGFDSSMGGQRFTDFSVKGSTAASNQFIKACGLQDK